MKDFKRSFSFTGTMTAAQAADYLEGMAKAIRAGVLTLETERNVLGLQPTGVVGIEVEGKRKGDEEKVAFEMRWRRAAVLEAPSLKISDQAPPPEPEPAAEMEVQPVHVVGDEAPVAEPSADDSDDDEDEPAEPKKKKKRRKKKK